jgi:ribonuclease-3
MKILQEKLGYRFRNPALLRTALTHSSYANESHGKFVCNERLEFLGDSVLGMITAEYLYTQWSDVPEGVLTRHRAALVCEKALCKYARELGIGSCLLLGRGERHSGGDNRPSILADAFEAVLAAIYLDGGIEPAKKLVLRFISREMVESRRPGFRDYKTQLQEIIQQNPEEQLEYVLAEESGPDHDKHFVVEVRLNSNVLSRGGGRSKKEAEQQAAREALSLMGY